MANELMTRTLDALSHDFARNAQDASAAAHDLSALARLARTVADDLGAWLDRLAALSCGKPCDQARAAVLLLGSVFAEMWIGVEQGPR